MNTYVLIDHEGPWLRVKLPPGASVSDVLAHASKEHPKEFDRIWASHTRLELKIPQEVLS